MNFVGDFPLTLSLSKIFYSYQMRYAWVWGLVKFPVYMIVFLTEMGKGLTAGDLFPCA